MTGSSLGGLPLPRRPTGRLGAYAPLPLVGVAALLVVLIVFTPLLVLNTRQPTPGILTQAELVVDREYGNSTMHFYVWALGETIRYDSIHVGIASAFGWAGSSAVAWSNLTWSQWDNASGVLSVIVSTSANPVALNITAHYVSPSGTAWYVGLLAFYVWSSTPPGSESLIAQSGTSGVAVPSSTSVSNSSLPLDILLHNAGSGATP